MKEPFRADRSDYFVRWFQTEGLCNALRHLSAVILEAGPAARECLRCLRHEFVSNASDNLKKAIPAVTDTATTSDMIVIADVLRASMTAFLSSEDIQERGRLGFHTD